MWDKIVFLDIDGTLLDHEKQIPHSAKEAIRQLKENRVTVAISTGRAPFMFQDILRELDIHSYVSINGQYVVHEDKVVYENPLDKDQLEKLQSYAVENEHPIVYQRSEEHTSELQSRGHLVCRLLLEKKK